MRLAALLTCFNRVATTRRALASLCAEAGAVAGLELTVFLVDDASPDRTGTILAAEFPGIRVIDGTGKLFWNRGMHLALETAKAAAHFDAFLFLNDDVEFVPGAIASLFEAHREADAVRSGAILVGAVKDAPTGATIYSGMRRRPGGHLLKLHRIEPGKALLSCDAGNGNVILFPARAIEILGNLDPRFRHAIGDIDILYRAGKLGLPVLLAPGHVAIGHRNPLFGEGLLKASLTGRAKLFLGPKGDPVGFLLFFWKHGGWAGLLSWSRLLAAYLLGTVAPREFIARRRRAGADQAQGDGTDFAGSSR